MGPMGGGKQKNHKRDSSNPIQGGHGSFTNGSTQKSNTLLPQIVNIGSGVMGPHFQPKLKGDSDKKI